MVASTLRTDNAHPVGKANAIATQAAHSPRYEAHENPPPRTALGYGFQFSLLASASLLVTPVIVANESGRGEPAGTDLRRRVEV